MAAAHRSARVVALESRTGRRRLAYEKARDAYFRADYTMSLEFLELDAPRDNAERADGELLRARIGRARDDVDLWYAGADFARVHLTQEGDRLYASALFGAAARRRGENEKATRVLRDVRRCVEVARPDFAPAAYILAFEAWSRREYVEAEKIVDKFMTARVQTPDMHQLRGWIEVKRERYAAAAPHFIRSLDGFRRCVPVDRRCVGSVIFALVLTASEIVDLKLIRRAVREVEQFEWPKEMWPDHFRALTHLRLCRMLQGDLKGAYFAGRRAFAVAGNPAFAAMAELAMVEIAHVLGDEGVASFQLSQAWDVLRGVRWTSLTAEERMALSDFVLQASSSMAPQARRALVMLRSSEAKRTLASALDREDRRSIAYERWAEARVAEVSGFRDEALRLYATSYTLWRELGYLLRAALVGLDARRLDGRAVWLEAYDELLRKAPPARLTSDPAIVNRNLPYMTPAQLRVLRYVLEGQSVKATASAIGCSPFTVTNHMRKLFVAFAVHTREELKARCAAQGFSAQALRTAGYG